VLNNFYSLPLISDLSSIDIMIGYCVKCRAKREMAGTKAVTLKNGKPATKGTCPTCSTAIFRIGKA
jgi:hypothetical protein